MNRDHAVNGQNQYTGTVSNGSPSATFTHDANGNLTVDGARSYVYDVENRSWLRNMTAPQSQRELPQAFIEEEGQR